MKKLLTHLVFLLLGISLCLSLLSSEAIAAKKSKKDSSAQELLKVINNSGETVVYGSVLSPKEDEVNINLSKKVLKKIRTVGIENLSISLTSSLDSTKTYLVPSDAINLGRKKINETSGKYLIISIFNLSTPSGITISPSSLPAGNYKLRVQGKDLDITTDAFNYQTPALIVGTVDSNTTGLVTVEDLQGNNISGRTVTTNPNGTFFTEVRANKINNNTKARKHLKSQVDNNEENNTGNTEQIIEEIDTGIVHVVTDQDLLAITPLDNDPENNAALADKPLEVNESSTLTANLAMENEELAAEVAKDKLEELESSDEDSDEFSDEFNGNDFTCDIGDIGQFADKCPDSEEDTEIFASIGAQFKEFVKNADCSFPEFRLIKKIIPLLPDFANAQIGIGYCEINRETNDDRPCEIYSEILKEYKAGNIDEIPCPPPFCEQFKDIKPPICVVHGGFCENPYPVDTPFESSFQICRGPRCPRDPHIEPCFHRPEKDLYCKRIGVDIKSDECKSPSGLRSGPNWTIVKNSQGNEYCVPGNINPPPSSTTFFEEEFPRTPKDIAEECEVNSCHQSCEEEFGFPPPYISFPPPPSPPSYLPLPPARTLKEQSINFNDVAPPKCEACDCHRKCDAEAGRLIECKDTDQYFSKKCCERGPDPIIFFQTLAQPFPGGGFGPGRGPIGVNLYDCLCKDTINNFNEKGYVKPEAQKVCLESCPPGYEKDPNSDQCLPICDKEKGFVRDPGGICRKKCPEGSFDDGNGYCRCPEGQSIGRSGKCEAYPTCPQYCYNYQVFRKLLANHDLTGFGTTSSYTPSYTGSGYVPPYTGPGYIPPNTYPPSTNTLPLECQKCLNSSCPSGFKKDPATGNCINISNTCGNSNMYPNPNTNGEAQCICPPGLPYWDNNTNSCVATCPNGSPSSSASVNLPPKSPIPCSSTSTNCPPPYIKDPTFPNSCKCPDSTPYELGSTCVAACPSHLTPSTRPGSAYNSTAQVCKCPDGTYPNTAGTCSTTSSNYCSPAIAPTTSNPCTCNPAGGSSFNSNNICSCSSSTQTYTKEYGCSSSSSTTHTCVLGEVSNSSNPCTCASGATVGSNGQCQCTNGQVYASGGCPGSTTSCPSPYITNPAYNSSNPNGIPPCKCPDGKYSYNNDCVATCPSPLVTGTPSSGPTGAIPSCLCPGTSQYPTNGQCGSITFTSAEISGSNLVVTFTSSSLGGGCPYLYNSAGTNIYSLCGSDGSRTENIPLSVLTSNNNTVVAGNTLKLCQSNSSTNCSNTVTVSSSSSPTPTPTPTPETLTLSSAQISGSDFTINYTKSGFSECVLLVKADDNTIILHNGVNAYGNYCSGSGTVTYPLNNYNNIVSGYQVKLCKGNGPTGPTNTGLYYPHFCSAPISVTGQ